MHKSITPSDEQLKHAQSESGGTNQQRRTWPPLLVGLLLLVGGLTINPWAMGRSAAVADSDWDFWPVLGVLCVETLLVIAGLCWLYWRPRLRVSLLSIIVLLPLGVATVASAYGMFGVLFPSQQEREIAKIGRSEKLYLALSSGPRSVLKNTINKSIADLRVPDVNSRMIFADTVTVRDLQADTELSPHESLPQLGVDDSHWPVASESSEIAAADLDLWRPLLDQVRYWKHAKFYIIHSEFLNEEETEYVSKVGFAGLSRLISGRLADIHATVSVIWTKQGTADSTVPGTWRIRSWDTKSLSVKQSDRLLFNDVVKTAIPDQETCRRACASLQEEYTAKYIRTNKQPRSSYSIVSVHRHPALSVVDIDRDGFDDLYVMARWGKNMLLRNQGDGTFEDVAEQYGLDLEDHCTGAIFADFDNDGDSDVFVGRSMERSAYLVNDNGKFVDRSESMIATRLPYLVSSVSAADYNGDGLLDVFFATGYTGLTNQITSPRRRIQRLFGTHRTLLERWLPPDEAAELYERATAPDFNSTTNLVGPPNMLLRNLGNGRFDVPAENRLIQLWRNTFQASWGDFDNDGDPDLYAANDFAPNNLLRNDAGTFVDVTEDTRSADIGFGMGASFGDYNNDGWLDLYTTNMYSKAGRRISSQLDNEELKLKYRTFARGNTLFRNDQGRQFEHVSGLKPPAMMVEAGGWGWGGQFVDIDNDGHEDIYTLSGFYTAPKEVTAAEDT